MALNFPDTPTIGQEWLDLNGITWLWDGEKWLVRPDPVETLPDAPADGVGYWRKDLDWEADPLQADAPNDANIYGRKGNAWAAINLSGSGTFDHNELTNRNLADQHPVSAVTGLQTALDGKAPTSHTHTLAQITDEGSMAAVNDAPNDGKLYARKSLTWDEVTGADLTHNDLTGRSTADAHPVSAITGLQTALDGKLSQATADPLYVNSDGDTMTGMLTLPATTPTVDNHATRKAYVDTQVATRLTQSAADSRYLQLTGGTLSGALTLPASNPTMVNHATRKEYVDDVAPWQGANKFVSTIAPTVSDGVDGDIWFEIEA